MTPLPDKLLELAKRVERNVPRHGDPEAFFVEKDEIARGLEELAQEPGSRETVGIRRIG